MAIPKAVDTQRDFTGGELDATAKRRDDDPFVRTGMRQLSNARTLNTGAAVNRPGRNLLQKLAGQGRVEEVLMAPGVKYRLVFTNAALTIFDASGTQVFTEAGRAWAAATVGQINFGVYFNQVFITFPGVVPEVLTWDGVSTWSSASYAERVTGSNQKRTPFYRIAPKGITLKPSGLGIGASITITASSAYFVNGMIGTRIRYITRQILITGVTNSTTATGTVEEELDGEQGINFVSDPRTVFFVGDLVSGSTTGAIGLVVATSAGGINVALGQFASSSQTVRSFITGETIIGTRNQLANNNVSGIISPSVGVAIWDEEVMNAYRGYPRSVTVDQNRLIFSDFPAVPSGIAWSAEGVVDDLYVGPNPTDGFFELVPAKNRVLYVQAGPESAEMVFCDNSIFYIPISPTNPLKPGSVQFLKISSDGVGQVQPRSVGNVIVYADPGLNQLRSIVATGAYYRPFEVEPLTELHSHLFNNIQAIALPTSVSQFAERYAYVLNGDGTIALGKYALDKDSKVVGKIGWLPWNGAWTGKWVSALNDVVLFVSSYTAGATTSFMLEQLDVTLYLDASLPINAIPAPLTPPGGKGPLWWLPTATVDLMDGLLPLGPHATDANGFIVPITPGEDLTSATLRAGFTWTDVWEPFVPAAHDGPDTGGGGYAVAPRMKKRRVARMEAYMMNSSGFMFARLAGGQTGPNLPAAGTVLSTKRIPAYNQDDDATKAPPLREQAYAYKPLGREHDPRRAIIKDTPGPLTLAEVAIRVSV